LVLALLLIAMPSLAKADMRGPAGFAPQESSPDNGGINPREMTGSDKGTGVALPSTQLRQRVVAALQEQPHSPSETKLNQPMKVGTVLQDDAPLRAIPEQVSEIYSPWRDYSYFKTGNEYIIVGPHRRIVAILVEH
jgi:hypothetical protein